MQVGRGPLKYRGSRDGGVESRGAAEPCTRLGFLALARRLKKDPRLERVQSGEN